MKRKKILSWHRAEYAWRLFFPPRCLTCQKLLSTAAQIPLCRSCGALFSIAGLICPRCGQVLPSQQSCTCAVEILPLRGLFALSWYEGAWRQMLHRFKFKGKRALARPLGHWLATLLKKQTCWQFDLAVPVPLHRRRQDERGYNQAHLLARFAAETLGIPLAPLLSRPKSTAAQSGLPLHRRLGNVRGAFVYRGTPQPGKRVLLIDDIYSTGATMREAAGILHQQGLIVFGAVAAFTPRLT